MDRLHVALAIGLALSLGTAFGVGHRLDGVRQDLVQTEAELDLARTRLADTRQTVRRQDRQIVRVLDRVEHVRTAARRTQRALAARADRLAARLTDQRSRQRRVRDYLVNRFGLAPGRADVLAGHLVDAAARSRQRYGVSVDATLLAAQISTESGFRPDARSGAGALGLMQVMPFHVRRYDFLHGRADLLNPRLNVRAGAYVLAEALARHDSPRAALRAYHGGPAAVTRPKQVTRNYVRTVMRRWAELS